MIQTAIKQSKINQVYKIIPSVSWDNFIKSGERIYWGTLKDKKCGFIHLSTHGQLYDTYINKFAKYNPNKLEILAINASTLLDLRWELGSNGVSYPHAYLGITPDDVLWTIKLRDYQFNANGI
jgi:uncharacterized protein (DUF952 family)